MPDDRLKNLRLMMRADVRELALAQLVAAVRTLPNGDQSLRLWATRFQAGAQHQTIPGVTAAESDLLAGEYQEALQEMFAELGL